MKTPTVLLPLLISVAACGAYQPAQCVLYKDCPEQVTCDSQGRCRRLLVFAAPDYYVTQEDRRMTIPPWRGVLANDTGTSSPLQVGIVTSPEHGVLDLRSDGSFEYEPDPEYSGDDSFQYQALSGAERSTVATVLIRVASVNDHRPVGREDVFGVRPSTVLQTDHAHGVLNNDRDPDEDPIYAILDTAPEHGELHFRDNGAFTYIPDTGFSGVDSFAYCVSDGRHVSEPVQVRLMVQSD